MRVFFDNLVHAQAVLEDHHDFEPFFIFRPEFKGKTQDMLYTIVYMLEANRLLYPPQKPDKDYQLYLTEKGKFEKHAGGQLVFPSRKREVDNAIPMLAAIRPN